MIFKETSVFGAKLIELEKRGDDRGFFARFFCKDEFKKAGLVSEYMQINNSLSAKAGTLRGLHYQLKPNSEVKVVRCVSGALFDVVLDLRRDSPTFGKWFGAELTAENRVMMYVPRGCAHGFITLTDDTEALYLVSDCYAPHSERGVRYNDPQSGIVWPIAPQEVSNKDLSWPDLDLDGAELLELAGQM